MSSTYDYNKEWDATAFNNDAKLEASVLYSSVYRYLRENGHIRKDRKLTAMGRYTIFFLARDLIKEIDRQGDEHYKGHRDPPETATGHKLTSWLLSFVMKVRKSQPKPDKEPWDVQIR